MTRLGIATAAMLVTVASAAAQDGYRVQEQRICRMRITTIQPASASVAAQTVPAKTDDLPMPRADANDPAMNLSNLPIPNEPPTVLPVNAWHSQTSFTDVAGRRWEYVTGKWMPSRRPDRVRGWILKMNDKHYLITPARELFAEQDGSAARN